jgi:hypothetical protein
MDEPGPEAGAGLRIAPGKQGEGRVSDHGTGAAGMDTRAGADLPSAYPLAFSGSSRLGSRLGGQDASSKGGARA